MAEKISFLITDKANNPIPGVQVAFKIFDITAVPDGTSDADLSLAFTNSWNSANPVLYPDLTTTLCTQRTSPCSADDAQAEKARAITYHESDWLGSVSGGSTTSDATGTVWTPYHTPNIFGRTMAIVMRVPENTLAANLVQYARVQTDTIAQFIEESGDKPINLVLDTAPTAVLSGVEFNLLLSAAALPDTGARPLNLTMTAKDVPDGDNLQNRIPNGPISCSFTNGQCLVPGGPFKVMSPGTFTLSITPSVDSRILKAITDQPINVEKGPASKLVVSLTPPTELVTPPCGNTADLTQPCFVISTDADATNLYPALVDSSGGYAGGADFTWNVTGPLRDSFPGEPVSGVQVAKPATTGSGVISVSTMVGGIQLTSTFTYQVMPGLPARYVVKSEHATGDASIEAATIPFKVVIATFDRKNNVCSNFNGTLELTVSAPNARPSSPPAGSGWVAVQPTLSFAETVQFAQGVATTKGALMLSEVPAKGADAPYIHVAGGVDPAGASSSPITVQPGPVSRTLLRTTMSNGGVIWSSPTAVNTQLNYLFVTAGYDLAGNYVTDVFSKFYGVDETFDVAAGLDAMTKVDPGKFGIDQCPAPPAEQPSSLFCPVHNGLLFKSGISTQFAAAGQTGVGRILAIPQLFDKDGVPTARPFLSGPLSITSGSAVSFQLRLVDKITGTPILPDSTGLPQVEAGQIFNLLVQAMDAKGLVASEYTGPKVLKLASTSIASWSGVAPVVPSGSVTCLFAAGACTLATAGVPQDFYLTSSLKNSSITVQETTDPPAVVVPGAWAILAGAKSGPDDRIYVANRKGGPAADAQIYAQETTLTTDEEVPLAAAVTDKFGNWKRDLNAGEAIWGGSAAINNLPNSSNQWTSSDIFATPGLAGQSTQKKFLLLSDNKILTAGDRDVTKYDIVFQPMDRLGSGYILVKSSSDPALVAYPTPKFTINAGALEHVEINDNSGGDIHGELAGTCFTPRIRLHDRKHNLLVDYTVVPQVTLKLFKPGVTDSHAGEASYITQLRADATLGDTAYAAGNTSFFPTGARAGFSYLTSSTLGGGATIPKKPSISQNFYQDWWTGILPVLGGEIASVPQVCLFDGRTDAVTNYAERQLQVEIPSVTIKGMVYPRVLSRGAGTLGSTATAHAPVDTIRAVVGAFSHFHLARADSQSNPQLLLAGGNAFSPTGSKAYTWGVDTSCPFSLCGKVRLFVHKHDAGCNFVGPASSAGAAMQFDASEAGPSGIIQAVADGALGSAAFDVTPQRLVKNLARRQADNMSFTNNEAFGSVRKTAGSVIFQPGAPASVRISTSGSSSGLVGTGFGLSADLIDQVGNNTPMPGPDLELGTTGDAASFYGANVAHQLTFATDALNSPLGGAPSVGGPYSVPVPFKSAFQTGNSDFLFRTAQLVTITASLQESSAPVWCTPWPGCTPAPRTYTGTLAIGFQAGPPVSLSILNGTNARTSTPIADGFTLSPGAAPVSLYGCLKDAEGNIISCNLGGNWSETATTYAVAGGSGLPVLGLNGDGQFAASTATALDKVDIYPMQAGTTKVRLAITSPAAFTATTGTVNVTEGLVTRFKLETPSNIVSAGVSFSVKISAVDQADNVVQAFTGTKTITLGAQNDLPTLEGIMATFPAGAQSLVFTNGVANVNATVYRAGDNGFAITAAYGGDSLTDGAIDGTMWSVVVNPGTLDHYITTAQNTAGAPNYFRAAAKAVPDNAYAIVDGSGSRFDLLIEGRDSYGNNLDFSQVGANRTLSLSLRRSDGTTTVARNLICLDGSATCLTNINLNAANGSKILTKLTYDAGGDYFVWATDANSTPTKVANSSLVSFTTSRATVDSYTVTPFSATATAGTALAVQIIALDKAGQSVAGNDTDLNLAQFTWTDSGSAIPGIGANNPVLPSTLTFSGGSAVSLVTFYKSPQTLLLKVTDNQATPKSGQATQSVTVSPSNQLTYQITATAYPSGTALANNSTLTADSTASGRFNLTVSPFDSYGNARAGESGAILTAVPQGGSLLKGVLQNSVYPNTGVNGGLLLDLSAGAVTLSGIYYPVGHTVSFALPGTSGTLTQTPTLIFEYTPASVNGYELTFASSTVRAGTPIATRVVARDRADNAITGLDTSLNLQTYTWTGPGVAPNAQGFQLSTGTAPGGLFSGGVADFNATFALAQVLPRYAIAVTDNLGRNGSNNAIFTVQNGLAAQYQLTAGQAQVAGAPFSATLSVTDALGNLATDWTADSLTWSWTGASSSLANPYSSTVFPAASATNGATTFVSGAATTIATDAFALYRAGETPQLSVTGSTSGAGVTASGSALTGSLGFTVSSASSYGYVYITDGTGCTGTGDCGGGSTRQNGAIGMATSQTSALFAHGFDQFGNYKGLANVNWSKSAGLTGGMAPTSGTSSSTYTAGSASSGTISTDCTVLNAGCVSDSTGTVTIASGSLNYKVTYSVAPSAVVAGTPFTVTVTAADSLGATVTSYEGDQDVTIAGLRAGATPEGYVPVYSSGSGAQTLTFTAGVASFDVTLFAAGTFTASTGFQIQISQSSPQSVVGAGPVVTNVAPKALHHYVTTYLHLGTGNTVPAKYTLDSTYADVTVAGSSPAVKGSRFDLRIFGRDQYGNNLNFVSSPKVLSLALVLADGTTAAPLNLVCSGGGTSCLSGITLNASNGLVSVTQLGYSLGGSRYIIATDAGGVTTDTSRSTLLNFTTSRYTIKQYNVTAPATVTAGNAFLATVTAVDANNAAITGADVDLQTLTFAWTDAGGQSITANHKPPNNTPTPQVSTSLPFGNGAATTAVTLYNKETLALQVTDDQTVPKAGISSSVAVNYNSSLVYDITSSLGASATAIDADQSRRFDLTLTAKDPYGNSRPGDAAGILVVRRISGPAQIYHLEGTSAAVQSNGLVFDASSGSATLTNAYYRVGQDIDFVVANSIGTVSSSPTLGFTATVHSVNAYTVGHAANVTAGSSNLAVTLTAVDPAGNAVTGVDAALGSQTFAWSGANASPGPSPVQPDYQTTGLVFTNGVATASTSLYAAQANASLTVTDNHSFTANGTTTGTRSGTSASAVSVAAAIASQYVLTTATTSPAAGSGFDVTVTARDFYNNLATSWTSDSLTFSWSGASASGVNPKSAAQTPAVFGPVSPTFSSGAYVTSGSTFKLFVAGETPVLTVTGTNTATRSGTLLTTTLGFSPVVASATGYVLITDGSSCAGGSGTSCGGSSNVYYGTGFNLTTDQTRNLYAHGFDAYGNYKALTNASWTGSNELAGRLSPASGAFNTLLSPNQPTAAGGVVTASCTAISAGCVSGVTGTINVSVGTINRLAFIAPSPASLAQDTEACTQLTVQTQDVSNNAANVSGDTTIAFGSTGGNGDFFASLAACNTARTTYGAIATANTAGYDAASTLGGTKGNRTATITAGGNSVSVWYANRTITTAGAATVQATSGSWSASLSGTISIGPTRRLQITTSSFSMNAAGSSTNTCMPIAYAFRDVWNNDAALTANSVVTWTPSNGTVGANGGTFYSDASCSTPLSSNNRSVSSGATDDTVYYSDTKANIATLTGTSTNLSGNASLNSPAILATVSPGVTFSGGPFAITGANASSAAIQSPVTIQWAGAPGAKNYTLSYGTTTACTTSYASNPVTGTSVSGLALANNTYYFCLVANGYDASTPPTVAATSNGSYLLVVDSSAPTLPVITVPSSTVTALGPVTSATNASSGTTTFAGTATDSAPSSGLATVEVTIATGGNYWNGSAWTGTPTWNTASTSDSWANWTYGIANTAFTDGSSYAVTVRSKDNSGNYSSVATLSQNFTWKAAASTATLASGAPGAFTNLTSLNITVGGTGVTKYAYALITSGTCSSATYSPSTFATATAVGTALQPALGADGAKTLCVVGYDAAENLQAVASATSVSFTKEVSAPTVSVGSFANVVTNTAVNLNTATPPSASDGISGISTYAWSIVSVSGTGADCSATLGTNLSFSSTSVAAPTISVSGCTYGLYTLQLTATNGAGTSASATMAFSWDTLQPTQAVAVPSANGLWIGPITTATTASGGTTTLGGTAADAKSVDGKVSVQSVNLTLYDNTQSLYWNGSAWQAGSSTLTASGTTSWTYAIANAAFTEDHQYTLSATALNNAGTLQATPSTRTFVWHATAPSAASLTGAPGTFTNATNLAVQVNGGVVAAKVTNYKYAQNSGANCTGAVYSAPVAVATSITSAIGADGQYTLCVLAIDEAENVQATATTATFTEESSATKPTVTVGTPSAVTTNSSYNFASLAGANQPKGADAISGIASYSWQIVSVTGTSPQGVATTCSATIGTNLSFSSTTVAAPTLTVSGCSYGVFTLRLTAVNGAGTSNTTSGSDFVLTWDTTAATATVSSTATASSWVSTATTPSTVPITLTFTKAVTVTGGTPSLTLTSYNSGTTTYATAGYVSGSGTTQLLFQYTPVSGDNTAVSPATYGTNPAAALNISALNTNGATIADTVGTGNAVNTSVPAALSSRNLWIDTYAPTATTFRFQAGGMPGDATSGESKDIHPVIPIQSADVSTFRWGVVQGQNSCTGVTYGAPTAYASSFTISGSDLSAIADDNTGITYVTLCMLGTDAAANVQSSPTLFGWIKDTTSPVAPGFSAPSSAGYVFDTATPTISWSAATDINGIAKYELYVANGADASCTTALQSYASLSGATTSQALGALGDGLYNLCLSALDPAGNRSTVVTRTLQVETDTLNVTYTTFDGSNTYDVRLGRWAAGAGSWTTSSLYSVSSGLLLPQSSLALDATNVAYAAYQLVNGGNSYLLANHNGSGSWNAQITPLSSASYTVGTAMATSMDSSGNLWLSAQSVASGNTTPADSLYYWFDTWTGGTFANQTSKDFDVTASGSSSPLGGTPGYILSTSLAMGTSDTGHFVYSAYNGSNWVLRYRNSANTASKYYETVPVASACTDTVWAQVALKPTASNDTIAIAYVCATNTANTPCKAYYQERNMAFSTVGQNGVPTPSAWSAATAIPSGTLMASCSASVLTTNAMSSTPSGSGRAYRPALAVERRSTISGTNAPSTAALSAHVAWYSSDTDTIYHSSNESGSWATEAAASSLASGNAGEPAISLDQTGRTYIVYRDGSALKTINNNARAGTASTGGWGSSAGNIWSSSPTVIGATQVIGAGTAIGINGMAGSTNNGGH